MVEKGNISIHTENIFPIIKKFLYSDHEIFLRELVSNAVDATQKLTQLASLGEFKGELGDLTIEVSYNEKLKTLTVSDKGIGMTSDEIKKYINQIAFSGAAEFLEKYKDKDATKQLIGNFGLGFYSSFMVAKKVEITTKSYQKKSEPAHWECDGNTEFKISDTVKKERGTQVTLHLNDEDAKEFLNDFRINEILNKYCKFLPVPIKFGTQTDQVPDGKDDEGKEKFKEVSSDKIINNTSPLWTKAPADLKDEDYISFYKELYPFSEDPLFWIHLNVDYPFNLTGILYFPKIRNDFELQKNRIQLFSRQVFITDQVKDVVPEFLMLLHGVIDSPDIPLNVSRSLLQSDANVKKINSHITKKVADKLGELFKDDRKAFEEKWDDISIFVKYGMISEEKFYEKAKDFVLLKNTEAEYATFDEYQKKTKTNQTDKDKNQVYLYTTDPGTQDSYIQSAKKRNYDVLNFEGPIDSHFINTLEQKLEKVSLKRVDSDTADKIIDKDDKQDSVLSEEEQNQVKELFEKAINNPAATITVESMAPDEMPATITLPEFMRRMKDMAAIAGNQGMMGGLPEQIQVTINANHNLTSKILQAKSAKKKTELAKQAYDLALLSQNKLVGADLTSFIERSVALASK